MRDYPFLYVNHGVPDPDSLDVSEEVFLWFRDEVPEGQRATLEAGVPTALSWFVHWDKSFVYFGSPGDTFAATLLAESPDGTMESAVEVFTEALERWLTHVHTHAPLALFYGPEGSPDDDPWHAWSVEHLAASLAAPLKAYKPAAKGKKYLGLIRDRLAPLLARTDAKTPQGSSEAIATLNALCERHRPHGFVSRLTHTEEGILEAASAVATFVGTKRGWASRLEWLSPLAQLMFMAGYDCEHKRLLKAYPALPERVRALVVALPERDAVAAVPLLVMIAQCLTHDTPGYDRPRRRFGDVASEVLRAGFDQAGCTAATYARASRYLRWASWHPEALTLAQEGLVRFGERKTLLRAGEKAALRVGDAGVAEDLATRRDALAKGAVSVSV